MLVDAFAGSDDAAQGRVQSGGRRGQTPGQQQVVQERAVDVVSEDGCAGRTLDVQVRDLVAVRQRDGVPGAGSVGQPGGRLSDGRLLPEQLLAILQPDAAVERRRDAWSRKHGDGRAGGRASLDVGQ